MLPKPLTPAKFIPAAAWFILSFFVLFLPGSNLPEMDFWFSRFYPDKWIHVFLFGMLVFLVNRPFGLSDFPLSRKNNTFVLTGVAVSAWGLVTEIIQKYFVPGRDFELADWGADILGSLIAVLLSKRFFLR